jgi:hypothetical protein
MKQKKTVLIIFIGTCLTLIIPGCGIYTTEPPLNPPFLKSVDSDTLKFSGYNTETYFAGYVLWYKEKREDYYRVCGYKGELPYPTIPKNADPTYVDFVDLTGETPPRIEYTVDIRDLYPQDGVNSFYDLNVDYGSSFFFAVSAQGTGDEQSERVDFGKWPAL